MMARVAVSWDGIARWLPSGVTCGVPGAAEGAQAAERGGAGRGEGGLERGDRDPVGAGLGQPADLLVGVDHALVERDAIRVEIDEAGEGAEREVALAVAAEQVGEV